MRRLTSNRGRLRADERDARPANDIVLPRGGLARARLVLPRGASRTTIIADQALSESALIAAQFGGPPALLQVEGAQVTMRPAYASLAQRASAALLWGRAATTLRLSTAAAWAISIHGGASRVTADLRALRLSELEVSGGASELMLDLPPPVGVVEIRLAGGARAVTLRRPEGVPVHVALSDAGSQLALDAQYLHAIAGPAQLVAGPATAPDRYVVSVSGGASRLIVDAWEPIHPRRAKGSE
jgi:hypothetical protein